MEAKPIRRTRTPDPSSVNEFLAALNHPRKRDIETLRALVVGIDSRIREEVKWNAPSFYIHEHFATFKLQPRDTLQVVLHTGAKKRIDIAAIEIDDPAKLVKWASKDRGVVTFDDPQGFENKAHLFADIVRQWVEKTQPR